MKKALLFILSFGLVLCWTAVSYGSSVAVTEVQKLDANVQIKGSVVEYTLDVPATWKKYVYIEREINPNSKLILEKVVFYYKPVNASNSSEVLLEISLFDKSGWVINSDYVKLAESDKYVFAYKIALKNPFVFGSDRMIFDNMLKEAANSSFLKDYVSFPTDKDDYVRKTVSVNGKRITPPAYINTLKVVYVPVREVCQELGYSIGWNAEDSLVTISSGSFYTALGKESSGKQKYNIITVDGKSYVSTMFFLQVLKCSVEIDQYNNVRISKEIQQ